MPKSSDVVSEARSWIGTRYLHQHRHKGHGVDCVGLIIGVGLATEALGTWTPDAWQRHARYGVAPNPSHMRQAMHEFLVPIEVPNGQVGPDGSIAWLGWRDGLPMHLAIAATAPAGYRTIIHALSLAGQVVEHTVSADWLAYVEGWWRYPDLTE